MTMTTAEARAAGYEIGRGAFTGTTDDRADRWYVQRIDKTIVDRRGLGYRTRKDALQALEEHLMLPGVLDDRQSGGRTPCPR